MIRLRRLAEEFCDDWDEAVSGDKPAPRHVLDAKISAFIPRIRKARFRLDTWMAMRKHLERCIDDKKRPEPRDVMGSLLPWAAKRGLLHASLRDRTAEA